VNAFQAFVTWAVDFIESVVNELFAPIIDAVQDAVDDYCYGVLYALMSVCGSYEQSQTISPELLNELGDALHGTLFWVVFGLTLAIDLVLIALKVITNVWGFLLDIAVGFIIGIIIDEVFRAGGLGQSETASTSGVDDEGHYNIIDFRNNLESQGVDTDGDVTQSSRWSTFWTVLGSAVSVFDLKLGFAAWHDSGFAKMGKIGLTLSGLSLALSFFSFSLSGIEDAEFWGKGLNYLSFLIGLGATAVSFIEFKEAKSAVNTIAFGSSLASSGVALMGLLNFPVGGAAPQSTQLTIELGGVPHVG
jgi:hypothetical protein